MSKKIVDCMIIYLGFNVKLFLIIFLIYYMLYVVIIEYWCVSCVCSVVDRCYNKSLCEDEL